MSNAVEQPRKAGRPKKQKTDTTQQVSEKPIFPGFDYTNPDNGYLTVANHNFDLWQKINNLAELKVVLYLVRHTWGFQEYGKLKHLTVDEFMHGRWSKGERMDEGTHLSESAVKQGLKKAVSDGYVVCESDESDKGRIQKAFKLKMNEQTKPVKKTANDEVGGLNKTPKELIKPPEDLKKTSQELIKTAKGFNNNPRTEKVNLERNFLKEIKEKSVARPSEDDHDGSQGNINNKIIDFPEGSPSSQPLALGFAKMAMRECLSFCGEDRDDTRILTRVNNILEQSQLPRDDFRIKVNSVVNTIRGSDTRDIEVFVRLLEKACPARQPIAMEG